MEHLWCVGTKGPGCERPPWGGWAPPPPFEFLFVCKLEMFEWCFLREGFEMMNASTRPFWLKPPVCGLKG